MTRPRSLSFSSSPGTTPRLPTGEPAWFTPDHNAYMERLLYLPPGSILRLYQTHLVPAAQRVVRDHRGDVIPLNPQPGAELRRRNAFRRVAGRRRAPRPRPTDAELAFPTHVPARRPVPQAVAGGRVRAVPGGEFYQFERVQGGRVGDVRAREGSVSSRTRSRSVVSKASSGSGRRGS